MSEPDDQARLLSLLAGSGGSSQGGMPLVEIARELGWSAAHTLGQLNRLIQEELAGSTVRSRNVDASHEITRYWATP